MKRYLLEDMVEGEERMWLAAKNCEDARRNVVARSDPRARAARADHLYAVEQVQTQRAEAFAIGAAILRRLDAMEGRGAEF